MRRITLKQKLYSKRIIAKQERKFYKRHRRAISQRLRAKSTHIIVAPVKFNLMNNRNRDSLLSFLHRLRVSVAKAKFHVTIDFSNTQSMCADGVLLFKSELCRLLKMTRYKVPVRCIPPSSAKISQVLMQVGLYRLLKFNKKISATHPDVIKWRYAHGSNVDGSKYDEVLGHYEGIIPNRLAESLYVGLTEAMTNCHQHAYIDMRPDGLSHKNENADWWMFSQERDGNLTVVFCDLGVGIPSTLPKTHPDLMRKIIAKFISPKDSTIIHEAIEESRTRTEKSYRGKGLRQLTHTIEEFGNSRLAILSNKGGYIYNGGNVKTHDYESSIMGTLIQWSVPIKESPSSWPIQ